MKESRPRPRLQQQGDCVRVAVCLGQPKRRVAVNVCSVDIRLEARPQQEGAQEAHGAGKPVSVCTPAPSSAALILARDQLYRGNSAYAMSGATRLSC